MAKKPDCPTCKGVGYTKLCPHGKTKPHNIKGKLIYSSAGSPHRERRSGRCVGGALCHTCKGKGKA